MTDNPILDVPITPAYPNGYNVWVNNYKLIMEIAVAWYTLSRGHVPGDSDLAHGLWRILNECERWGTLRNAFNDTWPIEDQEPKPNIPLDSCKNLVDPTHNRLECVKQVARTSWHWTNRANSGINCHLFTREVARALQNKQDKSVGNWGLITKNPGEQQCNGRECGSHIRGGYGEDVVAFLPINKARNEWIGFDVVISAGGSNPSLSWNGPLPRRAGNHFICIDDV